MSSHHFVREGQEPAVLIDTPDISLYSFLDQIFAWNPVVMATERSLPSILANSIHIDHLITYENIEVWGHLSRVYPKLRIHNILPQGYHSLLQEILSGQSCKEIQILKDEWDPEKIEADFGMMTLTQYTPSGKWVRVIGGYFSAWFAKDAEIELYGSDLSIDGHNVRDHYRVPDDARITIRGKGSFWIGSVL